MKENQIFFLIILALVFLILLKDIGITGIIIFLCILSFVIGWSAKNLKDTLIPQDRG
jgi:hypothetical protein